MGKKRETEKGKRGGVGKLVPRTDALQLLVTTNRTNNERITDAFLSLNS